MVHEAIPMAAASDLERVRALFDALDAGSLDVDEDGCFSLSHGEEDVLSFQVLEGLAAMKCMIGVGKLPAVDRGRAMRSVLEHNLSFACADIPGTLGVLPTTDEVHWSSLVALDKGAAGGEAMPLTPQEFRSLLAAMTGIAGQCRQALAQAFEPLSAVRPTDLA